MNVRTQLKVAAAIAAASMLVAAFLLSFWMVLQVFAPKISDFSTVLAASPDMLLVIALAVGVTYVIKNLFD